MKKSERAARRFWGSIPRASDIKITHADGSVTIERVKGKKSAAKVIRRRKK